MSVSKNIKIVATLGPSSNDAQTILKLAEAGTNVFRLNMSHGQHEDVRKLHGHIRAAEKSLGRPVAILGDLQGPKIRCGTFEGDKKFKLEEGQVFRFDLDPTPGDIHRVCLPHPEIFQALEEGSTILVNDGLIKLKVHVNGADFAECGVVVGGEISNRKGVNIPSVVLPVSSLSEKDLLDLEFVCELGIDWLALSFVQRPEDVTQAKALVAGRAKVLSKIEKPAAVDAFSKILEVSDGIMVARGDLGVELPVHKLPPIQKRLIRACRKAGKPVIVATQIMESMITSPVPTRAEVSDAATAIYEGADAIMLSAESAAGQYPIEAVQTMASIAVEVEQDESYRAVIEASRSPSRSNVSDAITSAAREIAETTYIKAICCFTQSGTTALRAARERPRVPIVALTPSVDTARFLSLAWGLNCVVTPPVARFKEAVSAALDATDHLRLAKGSDQIAVTAGVPFNTSGSTNILRVAKADRSDLHLTE